MKEKIQVYRENIRIYWTTRSPLQQWILFGAALLLIAIAVLFLIFSMRTNYTPLYNNLTVQETGQIKETLDSRGVSSEVADDGTAILVPEEYVDQLKVELAAEGIPNSGSIDYEDFQNQLGFGMTDNEFSVMERAVISTELEQLIETIDGVNQANVMITLPDDSIWVSDEPSEATASIVLNLAAGYQIAQSDVQTLYHLVSRSVPNLPVDNIDITDQMLSHYTYEMNEGVNGPGFAYGQQREIQRDVENDLKERLQQMLGVMMGQDKVMVTVTADLDFTQEVREEELVEPVNEDRVEGIAVSVERITEMYEGEALDPEEGVAGTGEDDITNYPGVSQGGDGDYEKIEERINNDVNRIHRQIQESPYKLRDLGIQVVVEPPDPEDMTSLPADRLEDIHSILTTVVTTSIDTAYLDEVGNDIDSKIFVSAQPFIGKADTEELTETGVPAWVYLAGAIGAIALLAIVYLLIRRRSDLLIDEEEEKDGFERDPVTDVEDILQEELSMSGEKQKKIEQLAREKPEEFSKLLRTWLSED